MHVGRTYPYLREFWQCEVQFWPGYVPRKVFIQSSGTNGDSWDLLAGGVVSDVGLADAFSVGDPFWSYIEPFGFFTVEFLLHKIVEWPKKYSAIVRLAVPGPHDCVISTPIGPELRSFGGYAWSLISGASPPAFNGNIPALTVRAATWSEV